MRNFSFHLPTFYFFIYLPKFVRFLYKKGGTLLKIPFLVVASLLVQRLIISVTFFVILQNSHRVYPILTKFIKLAKKTVWMIRTVPLPPHCPKIKASSRYLLHILELRRYKIIFFHFLPCIPETIQKSTYFRNNSC